MPEERAITDAPDAIRSLDQEKTLPVGPAEQEARLRPHGDRRPADLRDGILLRRRQPARPGRSRPGQTVPDLGSGPGLDSLLAARRVGPTGKVIGVDLCPQMVEKARRNASLLGPNNAEFLHAGIEKRPLSDGAVDVVISNGVFNLCPDKPGVLAEAFRVLRPGGRPQMADILLHDDVKPEEVAQKGKWSD